MTGAPVRMRVTSGHVVHHSGAGAPFRAGDALGLPPDHAAELAASGHVIADPLGRSGTTPFAEGDSFLETVTEGGQTEALNAGASAGIMAR